MPRPTVAAIAVICTVLACGGHQPSPRPWLAERGRVASTWYVCARMGAYLRSTCDGDAVCEERVTREVTRPCYAARYRAAANAPRGREETPRALSPCFWDQPPARTGTPARYARMECDRMKMTPPLGHHCVAELRTVIEELCTEGAPDLTGAGP